MDNNTSCQTASDASIFSASAYWECPNCENHNHWSLVNCEICRYQKTDDDPIIDPVVLSNNKNKPKKPWRLWALVAVLLLGLVIVLSVSAKKTPPGAPQNSAGIQGGGKTGSQVTQSDSAEWTAKLTKARGLINSAKYYNAAEMIEDCRVRYPQSGKDCDALWKELEAAAASQRPKTGELVRTVNVQGGNELRMSAKSANVEVLAVNVEKESEYVRFFIRKGESINVYLPAGEYRLTFQEGDVWFSDGIGFGEFGSTGSFNDHIVFKYTEEGGWITYYYFEWTF